MNEVDIREESELNKFTLSPTESPSTPLLEKIKKQYHLLYHLLFLLSLITTDLLSP